MNRPSLLSCLLILVHCLFGQSSSQNLDLDGDLETWSDEFTGQEYAGLFEGRFYLPKFAPRIGGTHLYFKDSHWLTGEVKFRGFEYKNIDLQYDIYGDVLVVLNRAAFPTQSIKPTQSQIEHFILDNSIFKNLTKNPPPLGSGFYEIIQEGSYVSVMVKRMKLRDTKGTAVEFMDKAIYYKQDDKYFLKVGDQYHQFRNKQKFYSVFKEQKSELKKFIKTNRLVIKSGNDAHIKSLSEFCNELIGK